MKDAELRRDGEEEATLELSLGQAKTSLFLMKNQTFKLSSDLDRFVKEQQGIEYHRDKVWSDIILNEQSRAGAARRPSSSR